MSIWKDLSQFLKDRAGEAFSAVVETIRTVFEGDPIRRKQVAFSIAMIALSAKIAKADGIVTSDEVEAFQQIFHIPEKEFKNVSRLYNLAKEDVAGFDQYANQIKSLFPDEPAVLRDVMDGLFHIAKADGVLHEKELEALEIISSIFEFSDHQFHQIKYMHITLDAHDPYRILDADPNWTFEQLKKHHRKIVNEYHPDRLIARGVPQEFISIANDRLANYNQAWETIQKQHKKQSKITEMTDG
jgi:DnaJ like chaperone protein